MQRATVLAGVAARAVLAELAPTPAERRAKAPSERERGYLEAVDVLYGSDAVVRALIGFGSQRRRILLRRM